MNCLTYVLMLLVLSLASHCGYSRHYYVVPNSSTGLCDEYQNGTCFTLVELARTSELSVGQNITLSYFPGEHILTQPIQISVGMEFTMTGLKSNDIQFQWI